MKEIKENHGGSSGNIIKEAFIKWLGLFLVLVGAGVLYLLIDNIGYKINGIMYIMSVIKPVIYGAVIA